MKNQTKLYAGASRLGLIVRAEDASQGGHLVVEKGGDKHLPTTIGGKADHGLMGAAWAALHGGYRGNKYDGPGKSRAIAKLKRLYKAEGMDTPAEASDHTRVPIVRADEADTVSLNDVQAAVCTAAKSDARFNLKPDGSTSDASWSPWVADVEYDADEDAWTAIIQAADGKLYKVGFDLDPDGQVTLDSDGQAEVTRKTTYVEARCCLRGEAVEATSRIVIKAGDVSGHEFHGNQYSASTAGGEKVRTPRPKPYPYSSGQEAESNTNAAQDHSAKANASGRPQDHQEAADKHRLASRSHVKAAVMADTKAQNRYHAKMAMRHSEAEAHHIHEQFHGRMRQGITTLSAKDAVAAKGTGAGAEAGHATRKSEAAMKASVEAHDASATAHESGSDEDHEEAADLHRKASDLHSNAMVAAAKAGRSDDAERHAALMNAHDACADAHDGDDDDAVKSTTKAVGDILKAGDVAGHEFHGNQWTDKGETADPKSENEALGHAYQQRWVPAKSVADVKMAYEPTNKVLSDARAHAGDNGHVRTVLSQDKNHFDWQGRNEKGEVKTFTPDRKVKSHDLAETEPVVKATDLVHCRDNGSRIRSTEPWETGKCTKFVYLPEGVTTICAGFRDGAVELTVDVDEDTAKVVQASFDDLVSDAPKQRPFGCFEHREEEASLHPTGFEWGEVRAERGVLVVAEPTDLGARNVNGKVHRSWSPSFTTDAEYDKGVMGKDKVLRFPAGVRGSRENPAKVTGVAFCVGTLTNKPAFKNMPAVHAKDKAGAAQATEEPSADQVFARLSKELSERPAVSSKDTVDKVFARLSGGTGSPQPGNK